MAHREEGDRVPSVTFRTRVDGEWKDVSSDALFAGKRVIVFSLPGAFTPTCSSSHLPRYEQLAPAFRANGIDDVVCLSVNDAFVMDAWAKDQAIRQVRMIGDGNGEFSEGMGMLVDKADLGFGKRAWRYSMLVDDGRIEKLFVEAEVAGDPYEVSDADTMWRYLNPDLPAPNTATIFTRPGCSYCARAKALLTEHGIAYEEIVVGRDVSTSAVRAVSGRDTVPQVFLGGRHIGGADDLAATLG
jgi:glutaredoxin-like protein